MNQTQLDRIEAKLDALLLILAGKTGAAMASTQAPAAQPAKPAAPTGGTGEIATDTDLDGQYGNPEIRKDPPRWKGESYAGKRYSDCSPEYLEAMASFNDWRADESEKKGDANAKYPRWDAARARGWRQRKLKAQGSSGLESDAAPDEVPF